MKRYFIIAALAISSMPMVLFADNPCVINNDANKITITYQVTNINESSKGQPQTQSFISDRGNCVPFTPNTTGVKDPYYFIITAVENNTGNTFKIHPNSVGSLIDSGAASVYPKTKDGNYKSPIIGYTVFYGDGFSVK